MSMEPSTTECLAQRLDIKDGDIVTVIGAGGKHTLMFRVSEELVACGRKVIITTTTNLHCGEGHAAAVPLRLTATDDWLEGLPAELTEQKRIVVVASTLRGQLYKGLDLATVDRIAGALPGAVLLVKADGARKRLLKVPAEHEPAFPARVDVCVLVLSLNAIGKPLDESYVHRPQLLAALVGDKTIAVDTLVAVLTQPGGYAERLPATGRNVLYLSCCDTPQKLAQARQIFAKTGQLFHTQVAGDTITGRYWPS
jgi:probable selenium-dependent hydroxylase accessory protein YqeC